MFVLLFNGVQYGMQKGSLSVEAAVDQKGKGAQSDPNDVSRRYTDTFCKAVECLFEVALEVQRWTRARSECFRGVGKNYSYASDSDALKLK